MAADLFTQLRNELVRCQHELEANSYRAPPANEQQRLILQGRWQQLEELKDFAKSIIKEESEDDD